MFDELNEHAACVDAWLRPAKRLPPESIRDAFERALDALCTRARVSLGELAVGAIQHRVVVDARIRFPWLWDAATSNPGPRAMRAGVRFVLIDFLSVLAHLTGGILTRGLHEQLYRVPVVLNVPAPRRSYTRRNSVIGERASVP